MNIEFIKIIISANEKLSFDTLILFIFIYKNDCLSLIKIIYIYI